MVLLQGLNYDYTGQQNTILTKAAKTGATELNVENAEGFAVNDYLILAPGTEKAELVLISAITENATLTVSTLKFTHNRNTSVFRTQYNQMKFYESDSESGTYTVIAAATTETSYNTLYTNYDYTSSTTDYYYKRTFYNSTSTDESAIALSDAWQPTDEDFYITAEELRIYLQFGPDDYPKRNDMNFFIKIAMKQIGLDVDSSSTNILFIATLLQSKFLVMRALATKSIGKGYVQINAEGRVITKAYQELILEAENTLQEYKEFIQSLTRREATSTQYYTDTSEIDTLTRTDIMNIMNGVTDMTDVQNNYRWSYYSRGRR